MEREIDSATTGKMRVLGKPLFPRHFSVLPQQAFEALCSVLTSH